MCNNKGTSEKSVLVQSAFINCFSFNRRNSSHNILAASIVREISDTYELRCEKACICFFSPAGKMARSLKFLIMEVEGFYYLYSKNKGADQLRSNCEADLRLISHMQKADFLITQLIWFCEKLINLQKSLLFRLWD